MRFANVITALFAAGSIAMPLNKREMDLTIVTEVEYVDQNGNVISIAYETGNPTAVAEGAAATPQPQAPASGSPAGGAPAANSPAPQAQPSPAPVVQSPPASQPSTAPSSVAAAPSAAPSVSQNNVGTGAGAVANYVNQNANDDTTYVGWLDPTDPRFAAVSVYHHNIHRVNHSVSQVSWDQGMADQAQAWAEKCITEEEVPDGSGMGMNVAFSSPQADYNPSYWITGSWYNSEIGNYPGYGVANLPVGDGTAFNSWGHFSQVVWPNVTKIGCGVYNGCSDGFAIHSGCYYKVEGNIQGAFNTINPPVGGAVAYPNGQNSM